MFGCQSTGRTKSFTHKIVRQNLYHAREVELDPVIITCFVLCSSNRQIEFINRILRFGNNNYNRTLKKGR